MPNLPVELTRAGVVCRAQSQIGNGLYKLGRGGRVPKNPTPFQSGQCDCTGWIAWCWGIDRYQPGKVAGGDWLETTAMVAEAKHHGVTLSLVLEGHHQPGDAIVYGDRYKVVSGKRVKVGEGHTGIVEVVEDGHALGVIDCASNRTNGAVQRRPAQFFFERGAIVVRFKGLLDGRGNNAMAETKE